MRTLPWVASVHRRYGERGLAVVGLHTPETDAERDPAAVRERVKRLDVTWPVVLDNEYRMWDALGNRYWPAAYLIDRAGRIRLVHAGETHAGSADARAVEAMIERLLNEPAPAG